MSADNIAGRPTGFLGRAKEKMGKLGRAVAVAGILTGTSAACNNVMGDREVRMEVENVADEITRDMRARYDRPSQGSGEGVREFMDSLFNSLERTLETGRSDALQEAMDGFEPNGAVTEEHYEEAEEIADRLREAGNRVDRDLVPTLARFIAGCEQGFAPDLI